MQCSRSRTWRPGPLRGSVSQGSTGNGGGIIAVLALLLTSMAGQAAAEDLGQQVWLVSTRGAPHCGDLEAGLHKVAYWRLESIGSCRWLPADAKQFHDSGDASVPTTIVLHGARTDVSTAIEHAWPLLACMRQYAAGRPFRLVIWAWPADRMALRNRPDMQGEAAQTDPDAYYLASCLSDINPGTPLCLLGYSFGARIAAGGLHLLAGGQVACHVLRADAVQRWASGPRPVRAMFLAPAINADWLMPGRRLGLALSQVERVLVTRNQADRALRGYRRLYGRRGPEAMGRVGPICCAPSAPGCEKIDVVDVTCTVGRRHDWYRYIAAPSVSARLAWNAFLAHPVP